MSWLEHMITRKCSSTMLPSILGLNSSYNTSDEEEDESANELESIEAMWKTVTKEKAETDEKLLNMYRQKMSKLQTKTRKMEETLTLKEQQLADEKKKTRKLSTELAKERNLRVRAEEKCKQLEEQLNTTEKTLQEERQRETDLCRKRKALYSQLASLEPATKYTKDSDKCNAVGTTEKASERNCSSSSHNTSLSDPKWEQLRPHFDKIIQVLSIDKVLPKLFSKKLIDSNEYMYLKSSKEPEAKQLETLLVGILMKKGPGTFNTFCDILREIDGQQHIVTMISPVSTTASRVLSAADGKRWSHQYLIL